MTSIFAELPIEIKMIIYKNYLQKQTDFHIERFKNKDKKYIKVIDNLNEIFEIFDDGGATIDSHIPQIFDYFEYMKEENNYKSIFN